MPPGYVFTVLDQLLTHPITNAHTIDNAADRSTKIEFQLPDLKATATETFTVSIDSSGRIVNLVLAAPCCGRQDLRRSGDQISPSSGNRRPQSIAAPPTDEVQRLAPGDNLYPSTTTTTTTPALGRVDESDAVAGNKAVFDGDRTQLAAQLGAQADPKLTAFTYNTAENTIDAAFSYAPATPPSKGARDLFAWHVGKTLSDTFWSPGLVQAVHGLNGPDSWLPELRIRLGPSTYLCLASVEIAVDAQQISEAGWLRQCAT